MHKNYKPSSIVHPAKDTCSSQWKGCREFWQYQDTDAKGPDLHQRRRRGSAAKRYIMCFWFGARVNVSHNSSPSWFVLDRWNTLRRKATRQRRYGVLTPATGKSSNYYVGHEAQSLTVEKVKGRSQPGPNISRLNWEAKGRNPEDKGLRMPSKKRKGKQKERREINKLTNCPRQRKHIDFHLTNIKKRVWGESSQEVEDKQGEKKSLNKEKRIQRASMTSGQKICFIFNLNNNNNWKEKTAKNADVQKK